MRGNKNKGVFMEIVNQICEERGIALCQLPNGECFRLKPDGKIYMKIVMHQQYKNDNDRFYTNIPFIQIEKGYVNFEDCNKIVYPVKVNAVIVRSIKA
jgi:hypothetical protein